MQYVVGLFYHLLMVQFEGGRVMVSESLVGQLPDVDLDRAEERYVHVVIDRYVGAERRPLVGLLRSIVLGDTTEVEFKVELSEAMHVIKHGNDTFGSIELQHAEDEPLRMPGPFTASLKCVQDIDPVTQTCILAVRLTKR